MDALNVSALGAPGLSRAWALRKRRRSDIVGTQNIPQPSGIGTTPGISPQETVDQAAAHLEDQIGDALAKARDASEVRSVLLEFFDDVALWLSFAKLSETFASEALKQRASDPTYASIFRLVESVPEEAAERAERLMQAELSLLVNEKFQECLLASMQSATAEGMRPASTPGEYLQQPHVHPVLRKAFLGARLSDLAIVGIGAARRKRYAPGVLDALMNEFISGLQYHYGSLVGFVRAYKIDLPVELALLPEGPLNYAKILAESQEAWEGQQRLREEAKRAGLPAYPPMRPEDDASDSEDAKDP